MKNFNFLKKNLLFNKKSSFFYLFLNFYSLLVLSLFPLITYFFIRVVYKRDLSFLLAATLFFIFIYLLKILSDVYINRWETKFFLKLSSNLEEELFLILKDKKRDFNYLYSILVKDVSSYILFVRKVCFGFSKNIFQIILLIFFMCFFNKILLIYALCFIPIFALYILFFYIIYKKNRNKVDKINRKLEHKDISFFLQDFVSKNLSFKDYKRFQSLILEKNLRNRSSSILIDEFLKGFVGLFRILYLAYFGIFVILNHSVVGDLLIGLLFILMLASCFIRIFKDIKFYFISKKGFFRINYLLEKKN
jgi:hypothetical protein